MAFLRDLYRRMVIGSWRTPESTRNYGNESRRKYRSRRYVPIGVRVHIGDPCPCGLGTVCRAHSDIHGWFLGCTQFRVTGCRYAWTIDGRRLPKTKQNAARPG